MTRSRLIVHADDFGETVEITRGILECVEAGIVTSTSILAGFPGASLALREAARRGREVSFGVHLNFCEGRPLTRGVTLRPEAAAQVEAVAAAGVEISHLDSHKHLHQLPVVADAVLRVARRFGIGRVRCTLEESFWTKGTGLAAGASRLVRRRLARRLLTAIEEGGFRTTARVFDVRELVAEGRRRERTALLRRPGSLSEMFCHPGTERADREKPGSCSRHDESRFLLSGEFRDLLREAEVDLVSWWEV